MFESEWEFELGKELVFESELQSESGYWSPQEGLGWGYGKEEVRLD